MDNDTFKRVQIYCDQIITARKDIINDSYLIMIVGNKCDLRNNHEYIANNNCKLKICAMDHVFEWINKYKLPYIETSAKQNKNAFIV